MSDIFHEVEQDLRQEKLQKFWKNYGSLVIAAGIAFISAIAGWQLWTYYKNNESAKASAAYMEAHVAASKDDAKGALTKFEALAKDAPAGYAELAELSRANMLAATGKSQDAINAYKAFAQSHNNVLGDAARVRAGFLMADTAKVDEMLALLKPVADKKAGFGPQAREIIAYAYYRAGNLNQAQKGFELVAQDAEAPQAMRERAGAIANFIKSGGDKNVGTVPPVAETPAPATPAAATP